MLKGDGDKACDVIYILSFDQRIIWPEDSSAYDCELSVEVSAFMELYGKLMRFKDCTDGRNGRR